MIAEAAQGLSQGRKRTHGTGALYQEVSDSISRRDFLNMVEMVRQDAVRNCREDVTRITWHVPGMVWAFDDTEYTDPGLHTKIHLHSIRDLGSRYLFDPVVGFRETRGETVTENLERLFRKYGPPLFLKRGNVSNLNHHDVNQVLSEWMVIPVNARRIILNSTAASIRPSTRSNPAWNSTRLPDRMT